MNPGAFWREAYLVAYARFGERADNDAGRGNPVLLAANSADLALAEYRKRFTVHGQPHPEPEGES